MRLWTGGPPGLASGRAGGHRRSPGPAAFSPSVFFKSRGREFPAFWPLPSLCSDALTLPHSDSLSSGAVSGWTVRDGSAQTLWPWRRGRGCGGQEPVWHRAIHNAANHGHNDTVAVLLEHGANANAEDSRSGRTALHCATLFGYLDTAALLREHGGVE